MNSKCQVKEATTKAVLVGKQKKKKEKFKKFSLREKNHINGKESIRCDVAIPHKPCEGKALWKASSQNKNLFNNMYMFHDVTHYPYADDQT